MSKAYLIVEKKWVYLDDISGFEPGMIFFTDPYTNKQYRIKEILEDLRMSSGYISIRKHWQNGGMVTIMGVGLIGTVNQPTEMGDPYYHREIGFSKQEHDDYKYNNQKHALILEEVQDNELPIE